MTRVIKFPVFLVLLALAAAAVVVLMPKPALSEIHFSIPAASAFKPTDSSEGSKGGVYLTVAWVTQDTRRCLLLGTIRGGEKTKIFGPQLEESPCTPGLIVGWLATLEQQIKKFGDDAWDIARAIGASLK